MGRGPQTARAVKDVGPNSVSSSGGTIVEIVEECIATNAALRGSCFMSFAGAQHAFVRLSPSFVKEKGQCQKVRLPRGTTPSTVKMTLQPRQVRHMWKNEGPLVFTGFIRAPQHSLSMVSAGIPRRAYSSFLQCCVRSGS